MSIKAYTGRMGSGKTYEVVSVVILGALAKGRRVVSNVAGLDYDAMAELLAADGVDADCIGSLVQVQHDQVLSPDFWRTDETEKTGGAAFILPGDLLVLDEVWRFWEGFADRKMPQQVMNFFRMHRHFVDAESGFTCDVALISQDVLDIARRMRSVIEETYHMTKLTAVGVANRYRVDVHVGARITRKPLRSIQRAYDKRYFPLYSSHSQKDASGADAKEDNIDGRGNVFKGLLFKVILPLCVPVFLYCVWSLYRFFNPAVSDAALPSSVVSQRPSGGLPASSVVSDGVSTRWRLVGVVVDASGRQSWMIADGAVIRVLYDPPAVKFNGWSMSIKTPEGEMVTTWSGRSSASGLSLGNSSGSQAPVRYERGMP
ncbi:MAG: hypothetical protein LBJ59_07595 [Zoogloeaceae bacterium]|jgi:zona occludens toxin|nr:hypothetical protein [Zoogloeaceae bacterium]